MYDQNIIVQFLTGSGDDVITTGTADLKAKTGATVFTITGLPNALAYRSNILASLTNGSRLYLRGHGDWKQRTLGGWSPRHVAGFLIRAGLTAAPLISVTGCNCARAVNYGAETNHGEPYPLVKAAREALLAASVHSFAGVLHFRLGSAHNIRCVLYARPYFVNVLGAFGATDGLKSLYTKFGQGAKATVDNTGTELHHRRFSKIKFSWNGSQQIQEWVEYA